MRKGQIDIIGLMVIVVIFVLIGLFALKFSFLIGNSGRDNMVLSIKANNLANSIRMASVCEGSLGDAISACCSDNSFCRRDSCEVVSEEVFKILNVSLEEGALFEAQSNGQSCVMVNKNYNCEGVSSSINYLLNEYGNSEIYIKLCEI